jgi:hypothetical protein
MTPTPIISNKPKPLPKMTSANSGDPINLDSFNLHINECHRIIRADASSAIGAPTVLMDIIMAYTEESHDVQLRVVVNGAHSSIGVDCSPWMKRTSWNGYWLSPVVETFDGRYLCEDGYSHGHYVSEEGYSYGITQRFSYRNINTDYFHVNTPPPSVILHLDLPDGCTYTVARNFDHSLTSDYLITKPPDRVNMYPVIIGVLLAPRPYYIENVSVAIPSSPLWNRLVDHMCLPPVAVPLTWNALEIIYSAAIFGHCGIDVLHSMANDGNNNNNIPMETLIMLLRDAKALPKERNPCDFVARWINVPLDKCQDRMLVAFESAAWSSVEIWKIEQYNECITKETQVDLSRIVGVVNRDNRVVSFASLVADTSSDPIEVTRRSMGHGRLGCDVRIAIESLDDD